MSGRRIITPVRATRPPTLPVFDPPPLDRREVARMQRVQLPRTVPRRTAPAPVPGLVALSVLVGHRVVRRLEP